MQLLNASETLEKQNILITAREWKFKSWAPTLQNHSDKIYSLGNSYKTHAKIRLLSSSETHDKQEM